MEGIIRIEESDHVTVRGNKAGISGSAEPSILLVYYRDTLIKRRVFVTDIPRTVCGSVINNNDLEIPVCLVNNTVKGFF